MAKRNRIDSCRLYRRLDLSFAYPPVGEKTRCCGKKVSNMLLLAGLLSNFFREMQLFLFGYIIISICEIFTVGAFPLADDVRKVSLSRITSPQIGDLERPLISTIGIYGCAYCCNNCDRMDLVP